jgi:hypothetical protein
MKAFGGEKKELRIIQELNTQQVWNSATVKHPGSWRAMIVEHVVKSLAM